MLASGILTMTHVNFIKCSICRIFGEILPVVHAKYQNWKLNSIK